jgi:serine/threonine-protein kinase
MPTRLVAKRWELEERIGRGAMGEVWAGVDRKTGKPVAVKLSQGWAAAEPELAARFEREGKVLRRLKSPHVCACLDAGRTDDGTLYIVLERLDGETLDELVRREGYLPVDEAGRIVGEVLQALVVAHGAGVVHRDLSPSNVFLHRTAEGETVTKVIDFGIAKAADGATNAPRTGKGAMMGTLPFIAPEQLGDSANVGPRADLYAVGAILFYALTGKPPYEAHGTALIVMKRDYDPPTIAEATGEQWPKALEGFLTRSMARLPSKRWASAEVALAALEAATRGRGPRLETPDKPRDATPTLPLDDRPRRRTR